MSTTAKIAARGCKGTAIDDQLAEQQLATVTDTGDPLLEGRTLRIIQVGRGTELFERYLFCTLND